MRTHLDHIVRYRPIGKKVLDLGVGRGGFYRDAKARGYDVSGIDVNPKWAKDGVLLARAEELPFPDESFDFVNMNEVIEHVDDPDQALSELHRVLRPGGEAYVSVPHRFMLYDHHYKLPFVNFLPRSFFRKETDGANGRQNLGDMHYYTFSGFKKAAHRFTVEDVRGLPFHFLWGTMHVRLVKPKE